MQYFKFDDEIHSYQSFVRNNIKIIGNLIIISEQTFIKNTEKNFIDILAIDLSDKRLVIIELKNNIANNSIIGQSIKYYDNILRSNKQDLMDLIKQSKINIDINEIDFNPKILLIVPDFSKQLLRYLSYITNIDISLIKLNAIQKNNYFEIVKENYESDINLYNDEPIEIKGKISLNWNFNTYLDYGINQSKVNLSKYLINYIDNILKQKNKKFEKYFYKNKITLMIDNKVWGHIIMNIKNDNILELSILNIKNIDITKLPFEGGILKYKILSNSIKITFSQVPINFLINTLTGV